MLCSHVPSPSQCSPLSFQSLSHAVAVLYIFLQGCPKSTAPLRCNPLCLLPFPALPGCLGTCSPGDTGWSPAVLLGTLAGTAGGAAPVCSFSLGGISCWRKANRLLSPFEQVQNNGSSHSQQSNSEHFPPPTNLLWAWALIGW